MAKPTKPAPTLSQAELGPPRSSPPDAAPRASADDRLAADAFGAPPGPDSATAELKIGPVTMKANVTHTPAGLLALGACVTSILLGAAAIVWVSTAVPRRHPVTTALALRKR